MCFWKKKRYFIVAHLVYEYNGAYCGISLKCSLVVCLNADQDILLVMICDPFTLAGEQMLLECILLLSASRRLAYDRLLTYMMPILDLNASLKSPPWGDNTLSCGIPPLKSGCKSIKYHFQCPTCLTDSMIILIAYTANSIQMINLQLRTSVKTKNSWRNFFNQISRFVVKPGILAFASTCRQIWENLVLSISPLTWQSILNPYGNAIQFLESFS